jgi:hypothetical protein
MRIDLVHALGPRVLRSGAFLVLAALSLWPSAATAEEALERAKQEFAQAETLYRLASFREALEHYRASYELSRRPGLLFNIAQCHRQLKDRERAVFYYRLYLSDWERQKPGTEPPYRKEVEEHIAKLSSPDEPPSAGGASTERIQPSPRPVEGPSRPSSASRRAEPAEGGDLARTTRAPAAASAPAATSPRWPKVAGGIALGAGGAAIIVGIVFSALAHGKSSEFEDGKSTLDYAQLREIDSTGRSYQKAQIATLVVGGLLAAAGGGLLLWSWRADRPGRERASSVVVTPFAGNGELGLAGLARF